MSAKVQPSSASASTSASASSTSPARLAHHIAHPKFHPTYHSTPSPLSSETEQWYTPISAPAYFPRSVFQHVMRQLALHPEQNSTLILRADPLPQPLNGGGGDDDDDDDTVAKDMARRLGMEIEQDVRVRLMPKQPKRDGKLDQRIVFYASAPDADPDAASSALVVMIPQAKTAEEVPYYHPPVRKLAFQWVSGEVEGDDNDNDNDKTGGDGEQKVYGRISISYLPFEPSAPVMAPPAPPMSSSSTAGPSTLSPPASTLRGKAPRKRSPLAGPALGDDTDEPVRPPAIVLAIDKDRPGAASHSIMSTTPDSGSGSDSATAVSVRLQRTCLALLERLHKHGHGSALGYVKRVHHDVLVPREPFQDLYLVLKDRHKHLDSRVPKSTSSKVEDVKRHVWKDPGLPDDLCLPCNLGEWGSQDVAIATFLMLLWKDTYPPRPDANANAPANLVGMEWDNWGRPPAGFIDLGCGNGLLVHILISEGYDGVGYELRARRTWPGYPPRTRAALVELPIDMPSWFPETIEEWDSGSWVGKAECVVKPDTFLIGNHSDELTPWIPLLSLIPAQPVPHLSLPCCLHTLDGPFTANEFHPPAHSHTPDGNFAQGLEAGASRYKAYVMWLGWCGLMCGWTWEREPLRVPSTRGWGIIARKRWTSSSEQDRACREWALGQVSEVRRKGAFKVREKEGKDH